MRQANSKAAKSDLSDSHESATLTPAGMADSQVDCKAEKSSQAENKEARFGDVFTAYDCPTEKSKAECMESTSMETVSAGMAVTCSTVNAEEDELSLSSPVHQLHN